MHLIFWFQCLRGRLPARIYPPNGKELRPTGYNIWRDEVTVKICKYGYSSGHLILPRRVFLDMELA